MSFLDGVRKLVNVQTGTTAQQVSGGGEPTSENSVFTKQTRKALFEENAFNLDKKTIKLIEKMDGGKEFLLKIANLQDSDANTPGIQLEQNAEVAIKQEAIKFFKADKDIEVNVGTQALLGKFGVTEEKYKELVTQNLVRKRESDFEQNAPVKNLIANNGSLLGNIRVQRNEDGTVALYHKDATCNDVAVAILKKGPYYSERNQYYVNTADVRQHYTISGGQIKLKTGANPPEGLISDEVSNNQVNGNANSNAQTEQTVVTGEQVATELHAQQGSNTLVVPDNNSLTGDVAVVSETAVVPDETGSPTELNAEAEVEPQVVSEDILNKAGALGYEMTDDFMALTPEKQEEFLTNFEKELKEEIDELQQNKIADFANTGESPMKDMTLVEKRDYLRDRINGQKDLIKNAKQVTVSERGSTQRLTKDDDWTTAVKISDEKTDNGLPARISIQLPDAYGAVGPDGKKQVRYQTLHYDAETGCYSDKNKVRQFKLLTSENGITLMQVDAIKASEGVKTFLDKNVTAVQEKTAETVQKADNSHKMDLQKKTPAQMNILKDLLSSRNSSWEVYTQAGSEVGYLTGAHGLLEEIVDESQKTGVETYKDLSPMIEGLMSRAPEPGSKEVTTRLNSEQQEQYTALYNDAKNLIAEMAQNPEAPLKTGGPSGGIVRDLDEILLPLGQLMAENQLIEGINFANNTYLIGGSGSNIVTITPTRDHGIVKTDAQFTFPGDDAVYEMHSGGGGQGGRTVDFQDLVEHEDDGKLDKLSLIRNDITGNNRHGEIKFNAERAQKLTNLRFNDGVNSYPIKVKVNDAGEIVGAFVYSPDGKNKVPIEDLLNGRVKMPQNEPAE